MNMRRILNGDGDSIINRRRIARLFAGKAKNGLGLPVTATQQFNQPSTT
jgi:hypothetical protein